jgi:hypothetical protein
MSHPSKKLNREGVPTIGRGKHWATSSVAKLLGNRAAIGEYQPHKGRGPKRRPDGPPVPGYFPAAVTEAEFYAARAALGDRRGKPGRPPKDRVNVFAGLLFDARDGGTIQQVNKGEKKGGRLLVPYRAGQGVEGSRYCSFPFVAFEQGVLSLLREIDPREVLPREDAGEDRTLELAGRLAEVEAEIEKVKARLQARYSDAVADVLERHEDEQRSLVGQLAEASRQAASPLGKAWGEFPSLLEALDAAPDAEEARVRLRAALRRVCEGFWTLFVTRDVPRHSLAAVQVWFTGGAHRDYIILHRPATGGAVGTRPARWWARSLAGVVKEGALDLRDKTHAARLEQALLQLSPEDLGGGAE